jgi:hypothetical protein
MNRIKFLNFIFMRMFPLCILIDLFLIIANVISFYTISDKVNGNTVAFEGIIPYTSMEVFFAVAFILCLCVIPLVFFSFFYKSKSIYTLVQVQPGKNSIYNSFLISGLINLLGLWLSQVISIFICYAFYKNKSGLFLSVVRLDFFRIFFPFSVIEWLHFVFIIVTSVLAAIYIITIIMKRNYRRFFYVALWGMAIVDILNNFRGKQEFYEEIPYFAIIIAVCTAILFFRNGKYALGGIEEL